MKWLEHFQTSETSWRSLKWESSCADSAKESLCPASTSRWGGRNAPALDESTLPHNLVNQVSCIASVEDLKDSRETLLRLRAHPTQGLLIPNNTTAALTTSYSLQAIRALSILRDELEVSEMAEQLHRFRKRTALSGFFDFYELAQANPSLIIDRGPEPIGESSPDIASKQAPRLTSRVLDRIADLMFLDGRRSDKISFGKGATSHWVQRDGLVMCSSSSASLITPVPA